MLHKEETPRRRKTDRFPKPVGPRLLTWIVILLGASSLYGLIKQYNDAGNNSTRDVARAYQRCVQSRQRDERDNLVQTDALNATYDSYNRFRLVSQDFNLRLKAQTREAVERSRDFAKIRYARKLSAIPDPVERETVKHDLETNGSVLRTVTFTALIDCRRTYPNGEAASRQFPDEAPVEPRPTQRTQ